MEVEITGGKQEEQKLKELLGQYDRRVRIVRNKLESLGVPKKNGDPIGDYAEWLFARSKKLNLMSNSNAGYDAIEKLEDNERDRLKFQIKARRLDDDHRDPKDTRQLGVIAEETLGKFDFLIGLLFNEHNEVKEAYCIPRDAVTDKNVSSHGKKGYRVYLLPGISKVEGVKTMSKSLRCLSAGKCYQCRKRTC